MNPSTLLIVDDERTLARSIKLFMAEQGYEAEVAENGDKALELLDRLRPDLVFLDVCLPGQSGMELLGRIKEFDRNIAVIMMTAYGSIEGAVEAVKLGAFDYIKKPVDLDELKLLADRACESARLRQELSYYRERDVRERPYMGIIGKCEAMREIVTRIRQIAALEDSPPILITGETGTGKGLVARTLHRHSRRASRAFIEINCTALPATLMEAELFGYERGAFTDAKESKMGLFEAADGGFLYLDEVGDTELSLQGKLLRAVEERVIRRIGGLRDRRVDVTIVAATHRDLETEVRAGRFRKDLYYRLAVITIDLPPLRERGEDILLLAAHFLETLNAKYGKAVRAIDDRAARTLIEYPWPGNIRELSHVIERAVLWSRGDRLSVDQLSLAPAPPSTPPAPMPTAGLAHGALPQEGIDLAAWERSLVEQALRDSGGNQTKAAKLLRLSRDTLRYRLKKFGLSRS
ncbi:response regulator in two-component reguatory system, sigma54 dependent transcriptional regulator [Candidatus Methylomirabilis lanthanidiphila]|uniref:Response regulator in two-component reguatory system, sigma54 dependent transcriptional regulator n=1 Tax=Candidatus Methylomirabilis lanthanidiphila TaxID=2211376 RepID=A0A564ZKB7_9BACT|nr:sigma-54 dependent transcriptional regulator [Candidatus Methylomirabilis lanthanidiphila]VUZ85771.1 response regulator in two-component reguatory system, sigma54 dependent transcriptional regulator [Candidatus Methylomirabilis lanthanidiphila]